MPTPPRVVSIVDALLAPPDRDNIEIGSPLLFSSSEVAAETRESMGAVGEAGVISATLSNIAALSGAVNLSLYFTGAHTVATYTITATGRSLAAAVDAAAGRAVLGLGTAATTAASDYALAVHTHGISDVTGLSAALDAKVDSSGTWQGPVIAGQYGGTGVANTGKTITLAGNLTTTGAFNTTIAQSASVTMTLPGSSFTVARTDAAQSFTGIQSFINVVATTAGTADSITIDSSGSAIPGITFKVAGSIKGYFANAVGSGNFLTDAVAGDLVFRSEASHILLGVGSGASSIRVNTTGTASSSTTTGAVVITGGLGLSGALNVGGSITGNGSGLTTLNASNLSSGLTATTRGGVMSYQPNRTHNAEDVLRAGARPLRVLGIGDSAIEYPLRRMMATMAQAVGRAGGNNDAASWIQYSGTGTELTITELWNQGGLMLQLTSGQYRDYALQYGDHLAVCDRIVVGYVRRSGAGSFKVQSRTVDGGSWTDEGSTVSTANASVDYQTLSITPSGGTVGRQFRLISTSGTVQLANPVVERTTGRGIMQCLIPVAGADFDGYTTSTTAVRRAWLDSVAPDVIFIRYYDLIATLEAGIVALKADLVALGRDHTTDIVLMAPTPITSGDLAAHLVYHQQCKALAATYGISYVSTYEGFETRFLSGDGVHPTSDGWNWIGDETLRQLRWLDIPEVQLAAKHTDFNPSYQTIPDSTTLSALAQPTINLVPGWWRIRGHVMWASTGTGQGLKCSLAYSGSADYMRGVHLSSGAEGTAWPTSVIPRIGIGAMYFPFNLVLSSLTSAQNGGIRFDLTTYFYTPGALSLLVAKEATGGSGYIFEGTSLQAERIAD